MMENASFISSEIGDDYIVSFFVTGSDPVSDDRSIIVLRDKKWEALILEEDKGAKVSDEQLPDSKNEGNFLKDIEYSSDSLTIRSVNFEIQISLRKIAADEISAAIHVLQQMNFDNRFTLRTA